MRYEAAGYYHWPVLWVGSRPAWASPGSTLTPDPGTLGDVVLSRDLLQGLRARAHRDGVFVFDFSSWGPEQSLGGEPERDYQGKIDAALRRTSILNTHLVCLHTAITKMQNIDHPLSAVTPQNMVFFRSFSENSGRGSISELTMELLGARFFSQYKDNLPVISDWRLEGRSLVIEPETLEESFRLMDEILGSKDDDLLLLLTMLARGSQYLQEHDHSACLVANWSIVEALQTRIWDRYIEDNRMREEDGRQFRYINGDRKDRLEDFTASEVSEVLNLLGLIPFDLYRECGEVRAKRNAWLHNLESVDVHSSIKSMQVAEKMLDHVESLRVELPKNTRIKG